MLNQSDGSPSPLAIELASSGQRVAVEAAALWARVLRWTTMSGWLARDLPEASGPIGNLFVAGTSRPIVRPFPATKLRIPANTTLHAWRAAERALAGGLLPPVEVEVYFDAVDRLESADIRRAVVDCAMAAEISLRRRVASSILKASGLERIPMSKLLGMVYPTFDESRRGKFVALRSSLGRLVEARNRVVHSGICKVSPEECGQFCRDTKALLHLTGSAT